MTPRRILLLFGGFAAFIAAYATYAQIFGWIDGLPILPIRMTVASDGTFRPPPRATSPTLELLKAAFGENSPETEPAQYPTQLRFLQGEAAVVLAAGSPPSNPDSNRVTLSPFSIAIFGRPRAEHLLRPGEVTEVSTIHSDKAVLEFDRVIKSATEMNNAKLVRLELVSDPEQSVPDALKRVGLIHITNNQRSGDPNRHLVLRTVGPLFYRDPKVPEGAPPLSGPDIWTDAPVEIVDRGNLPRAGDTAVATASTAADQLRNPSAIAAIIGGQRLPPPTLTAIGMRVYLEPAKQPGQRTAQKPREGSAGFGGVRRVEFLESVILNLWVGGDQGLVAAAGTNTGNRSTPNLAAHAVASGLFAGSESARSLRRDLLQVETRGPFAYDADKNLARFDVLPVSDPSLPNDVQVTKVPPTTLGTQTLFSQVLELEMSGPPVGEKPADAAAAPDATTTNRATAARFKRLHAWTYTPGRFLTVSSDSDQLEAYGQDLVHEAAIERTQLTGSPLYAVQKRNVLTAGGPKQSAVLVLEPPPEANESDRKPMAKVIGPGRVELFDTAANATAVTVSWLTSMEQTRERTNDNVLDLYTLTDGAKFEDEKAEFWLKGKVIKLWLAPEPKAAGDTSTTAARAKPQRLQVLGDVSGHTADLDIEQAEYLSTLIRDITPAVAVAPTAPATPAPPPAQEPPKPAPVKPKAPTKPPMRLRARSIESWVVRAPANSAGAAPATTATNERASGGAKYQMEKVRCEGTVTVHQDPADPTKPRGTDILGSLLLIDGSPEGNILTVFGWDDRPGEVHNEETSLIGPKVVIDQLHNQTSVEGRGTLVMPSGSGLTGEKLKQAESVVVHFRDGMTFRGSRKVADFFGKVTATQGASSVTCHTLQVNFDRPVYLTQANRPPKNANNPADQDKPKIDVIFCYPAPADVAENSREKLVCFRQIDRDPATGRTIRYQSIEARELTLRAQARDVTGGEPYRQLLAEGPGIVRTWQPGAVEDDPNETASAPMQKAATPQTEMKLTIVNFSDRMTAREKSADYKDATFLDSIQVIHVPSDDPELKVERHKLPPRATLLTCVDKLVVWTQKKGDGPARQHMEAYGNAYLRNQEYDGWGETINNDGKIVIFEGAGTVPARIKSRFSGNDQSGRKIIYDRAANHYKVEGSIGGTITPPPPSKK